VSAKSSSPTYRTLGYRQISGATTPLTYSETVLDEHAVKFLAKFNGRVFNSGTRSVSEDGRTMVVAVNALSEDGELQAQFELLFNRVDQEEGPA
jgi:hypothetical protein